MKFICECGHCITDTTDYISYKAHLIPDQDFPDYLDKIDKVIEDFGASEKAMMKFRRLTIEYTKAAYQCTSCGNIFIENGTSKLGMFKSCSENPKKDLLRSVKGDEWQGFLHGEWVDEKPVWLVKKGYICADTIIEGKMYDEWDALEKDYYNTFNELRNRNVIRSSSLKKNKTTIHSWRIDSEE